ncbi:alpha-amylase family glycosyl hydrolase [Qipengyuania sp. JC766]|uniref:alpha-amylase family glycosyl hydrolase n=1 Tax=Qipengyuania sp. JC766 TaxID=3232139 RepID=UPI003458C6F8
MKYLATLLACAALAAGLPAYPQPTPDTAAARSMEDEVIYFVLPDRFANGDTANDTGGYPADRMASGFDPEHRGFYHGGDLKGLTGKLDYIQGMGVTAIWFAPIFKNKPVQGDPGQESAGYHGYWVTDFTQVDPHFGTNAEFKAFVEAAHARGMKVFMDIITNHTADVIGYAEGEYAYRSKADYPFSTRGGPDGARINPGFAGDEDASPENWARLTDPAFAYTPVVPEAERDIKVPAWLNDPVYYHNRGNSEWWGESAVYGDFAGLDDLATENPRVVAGMIEIFGSWIDRFGIDGFRIDTVKHVNPEFWQAFVPAMLERAEARGIADFLIFGEVYIDGARPGPLAVYTKRDALPSVLDFHFQSAVTDVVARGETPEVLAMLLDGDWLYEGGPQAALRLPTFLGNHDMGRFSMFVRQANPQAGGEELLARTMLGHAMLLTLRGIPTIYYGDEQGFVSDGNDQQAREDMFRSLVAEYNDNVLLGTDATTADENYDTAHPLYRTIARLSAVRAASPALRRGESMIGTFDRGPGLFSLIRRDPESGQEVLLAFNTGGTPIVRNVEIGLRISQLRALDGECPAAPTAPGSAKLDLPAFGWAVCELVGE